jgi:hypothetical protein
VCVLPSFQQNKKVLVLVPPPLYLIRFAPRPADWNKLRRAVCIVPGLVANEYMYIPLFFLRSIHTARPCVKWLTRIGGRNSLHVAVPEPHE